MQARTLENPRSAVQQLAGVLSWAVDAHMRYQQASEDLGPFVKRLSSVSGRDAVQGAVDAWIKQRCEEATEHATNDSHLTITPERLEPAGIGRFELRSGLAWNAEAKEWAAHVLKTFPFQRFIDAIDRAKGTIEGQGFEEAANKLALEFGFRNRCRPRPIKRQKGRVLIEIYHACEYGWDRQRKIAELRQFAQTFEAEAGVSGLDQVLRGILDAEGALPKGFGERVESRTTVNAGGKVHAVFYKEKIKLHFDSDVFDALVGFIQAHAGVELCEIKVA